MGVAIAIFYGGTSRKIVLKLKNAHLHRALKGDFHHLSLNGKSNPRLTIPTQNTLSDLKI